MTSQQKARCSNGQTIELNTEFCPHRYEVTFHGVIGIGKIKDEAIKEAQRYD